MGRASQRAKAQPSLIRPSQRHPSSEQLSGHIQGVRHQRPGRALPQRSRGLPGRSERHVSRLLSPNKGTAEGAGGWTVLSRDVQPGCCKGRSRPLLTSSVYWTSSTAYFCLKCSLEWILKKKHRKRQRQGLAAAGPRLPSELRPGSPGPTPAPAGTWHRAGLPNTGLEGKGHWARVTAEPHLHPSPLPQPTSAPPASW